MPREGRKVSEENEAARRERLAEIQEHLRVLINSDLIIGSEKGELRRIRNRVDCEARRIDYAALRARLGI